MQDKPKDVSEFEWAVGKFVRRVLEFLAICAVALALQALYTTFNPANPPDKIMTTKERGVQAFRDCVKENTRTPPDMWYRAMKGCQKRKEFFSHKPIDWPY